MALGRTRDKAERISPVVSVLEHPPDGPQANERSSYSLEANSFQPTDATKKRNTETDSPVATPYLIIGFDTEFKTPDDPVDGKAVRAGHAKYEVLSYQFHCRMPSGKEWSGIACPEYGERMSLGEFLVFALGKGVNEKRVENLPSRIYLVGHFTGLTFQHSRTSKIYRN